MPLRDCIALAGNPKKAVGEQCSVRTGEGGREREREREERREEEEEEEEGGATAMAAN